MNTLYLMCGLPFSGKSTVARAIAERIGCMRVSLDDMNAQRGLGFGGDGIAPEEWEKSHQIAIDRLNGLLPKGDAILGDTCCFRWIRDRYRNCAAKVNTSTCVIYLYIERDILTRRMKENELTHVRHGVRAAEKINYPNLLVYCPVFCVASSGEYPDMHRLTRLETEQYPAQFGIIYFFRDP